MSHEQAASAIIAVLISEKNNSRKNKHKRKVGVKPCLKRKKNFIKLYEKFYETLLAELRLGDKYNYKNYLRMTSENFQEIFQLIKDNITKENTKKRDLISLRL